MAQVIARIPNIARLEMRDRNTPYEFSAETEEHFSIARAAVQDAKNAEISRSNHAMNQLCDLRFNKWRRVKRVFTDKAFRHSTAEVVVSARIAVLLTLLGLDKTWVKRSFRRRA